MKFLEKDLEQIIFEADKGLLANKGLYIRGKMYRQLRIGNYGIADLVTINKPEYVPDSSHIKGNIIIYELKQDKITVSAFLQALGYAKGVFEYLKRKNKQNYFNVQIKLIGKQVDLNSTFIYLTDFLDYELLNIDTDKESGISLEIYTYDYFIDGIEFKNHYGYDLKERGF